MKANAALTSRKTSLIVVLVLAGVAGACLAPAASAELTLMPGDLNADGRVDILDVKLGVNILRVTETNREIVSRAHVNSAGSISVQDTQLTINDYLGSPATPTPTPTTRATKPPTAVATQTPTNTPTVALRATPKGIPTHTPGSPTSTPASVGTFTRWSKVEIQLTGPQSTGTSAFANPFKIQVDVVFSGPGGRTYAVPAFYDGNGIGGMNGNVWRARFSPDANGTWTYQSSSLESTLNGESGSFSVVSPSGCVPYSPGRMPSIRCMGRLTYSRGHYLKFAEGPHWLKGGEDDPEDFLASGVNAGFSTKQTAVNYLASQGANSIYLMLHNIDGDGNNVWPWVGSSASNAKLNHEHFDVAKLQEWEDLFTYIQSRGLVLHLVLEDDSAWTGFNRPMYYREMIARFGHHNAIVWNISEEYNENYSASQAKGFAATIRSLDPYDHPITIHNAGGLSAWEPFLGDNRFDITSFQTAKAPQNAAAAAWFDSVESSGRTIPISFDETGQINSNDRDLSRHIVWSVYLGGGNFELHTSPLSSYQDFAAHFADMRRARGFVEGLPFWQMEPLNSILASGKAYVFAKAGDTYAAYLFNGGSIDLDLSGASGSYSVDWFNPRTGVITSGPDIGGGAVRSFLAPFAGDAVLLLKSN